MGTAESAEGGEAGFPPAAAGPGGPESGLGERGRLGGRQLFHWERPPQKMCISAAGVLQEKEENAGS